MPTLVLAAFFWLHLLATVLWIGGLAILTIVVWPGIMLTTSSESASQNQLLTRLEKRFRPLANISLVVLIVTGIIQMDGDPNYEGFFIVTNSWSLMMLLKHVVVAGMVLVTAIIQIFVLPELDRLNLIASKGQTESTTSSSTHRRFRNLTVLNLILGILVLLFTAALTAI